MYRAPLFALALTACTSPTDPPRAAGPRCALAREQLSPEAEALLLRNAAGVMKEAAFVGQATSSRALEFVYAISLFDEVASAGWLLSPGCDELGGPTVPTCGSGLSGDALWSCVQPTCLDESTLRIDAWYAESGNGDPGHADPFTLGLDGLDGELIFLDNPLRSWVMDASVGYTRVGGTFGARVQHLTTAGTLTDLSYEGGADIVHGEAHPAFTLDLVYPNLTGDAPWTLALDFGERGLDGALYWGDLEVASLVDQSEGEDLRLALAWADCPSPEERAEALGCDGPRAARVRCDTGLP